MKLGVCTADRFEAVKVRARELREEHLRRLPRVRADIKDVAHLKHRQGQGNVLGKVNAATGPATDMCIGQLFRQLPNCGLQAHLFFSW